MCIYTQSQILQEIYYYVYYMRENILYIIQLSSSFHLKELDNYLYFYLASIMWLIALVFRFPVCICVYVHLWSQFIYAVKPNHK